MISVLNVYIGTQHLPLVFWQFFQYNVCWNAALTEGGGGDLLYAEAVTMPMNEDKDLELWV